MMNEIDFKPHPDALYFHIANDALVSAHAESDDLKIQQYVATSLVFSALCLEAYVNQEFCRHAETEKVIAADDRLSLQSKWLMLPLLLGATRTFDKGAEPCQTFLELLALRNTRLVHFKPQKESLQAIQASKSKKYLVDLLRDVSCAEKYHRCISEMICELHRLTNKKTRVPEFLSGHRYSQEVPVSRSFTVSFESREPSD